jgi:hypothetical protein
MVLSYTQSFYKSAMLLCLILRSYTFL